MMTSYVRNNNRSFFCEYGGIIGLYVAVGLSKYSYTHRTVMISDKANVVNVGSMASV